MIDRQRRAVDGQRPTGQGLHHLRQRPQASRAAPRAARSGGSSRRAPDCDRAHLRRRSRRDSPPRPGDRGTERSAIDEDLPDVRLWSGRRGRPPEPAPHPGRRRAPPATRRRGDRDRWAPSKEARPSDATTPRRLRVPRTSRVGGPSIDRPPARSGLNNTHPELSRSDEQHRRRQPPAVRRFRGRPGWAAKTAAQPTTATRSAASGRPPTVAWQRPRRAGDHRAQGEPQTRPVRANRRS